jgi:hypothetical protein
VVGNPIHVAVVISRHSSHHANTHRQKRNEKCIYKNHTAEAIISHEKKENTPSG